MEPQELLRRLHELLAHVPPLANRLTPWLKKVQGCPLAMRTLDELHRGGADLRALAGIAILFLTQKDLFESGLQHVDILLEDVPVHDIDPIIAAIDKAEAHGAASPVAARMYRRLKKRLDARAREIRAEGERLVEIGERRFAIEPTALVVRTSHPRSHSPAPDAQPRRGHPSDDAENVLSALVAGHLRATTGKPSFSLTGRFVAHVVGLNAPSGPDSDAVRSFEKRARQHWRSEALRPLIEYLADLTGLRIRFD